MPTAAGAQLPLGQLADIEYVRGPQVIKSENTFPVAYITFGYDQAYSSIDVVERASTFLENRIAAGELVIPPGVYYSFAGEYEQELSFQRTLRLILPLSFFLIFLILFARFASVPLTLVVFLQIFTVWSGAFTGIWLVGQGWFLDFALFGANLRELYNLRAFHLSVPVWVGFLALFGIATDDAVVTATYLKDVFAGRKPTSREEVRAMVVEGARKRIRPCFMTTITTVLALVPILTSIGRGAEVMLPMAIPLIAGMTASLLTLYITPVIFAWLQERHLPRHRGGGRETLTIPAAQGCHTRATAENQQ